MRISVVADVHGNVEALARVAERAERLVILGDLLDYVDYHDPERGILAEVFGADQVRAFTALRSAGAFPELRHLNARLWGTLADPVGTLAGMVRERYRRVLSVIPDDTILTLGNVDVAAEWEHVAGAAMPYRDGEIVVIDGIRFAFVAGGVFRRQLAASSAAPVVPGPSGGAPPPPWRPFMRPQSEFREIVDHLGAADVLCSHVPPDMALLRYDRVPARIEMAGPGLTGYMDRHCPPLALFGHVHQPMAARQRYRRTECVNVGHFQRTGRAYVVDSDRVRMAGFAPRTEPRTQTALAGR